MLDMKFGIYMHCSVCTQGPSVRLNIVSALLWFKIFTSQGARFWKGFFIFNTQSLNLSWQKLAVAHRIFFAASSDDFFECSDVTTLILVWTWWLKRIALARLHHALFSYNRSGAKLLPFFATPYLIHDLKNEQGLKVAHASLMAMSSASVSQRTMAPSKMATSIFKFESCLIRSMGSFSAKDRTAHKRLNSGFGLLE